MDTPTVSAYPISSRRRSPSETTNATSSRPPATHSAIIVIRIVSFSAPSGAIDLRYASNDGDEISYPSLSSASAFLAALTNDW